MPKEVKHRLCGGTFLTLFQEARKPRMGVREHYKGERDGMSDPEAIVALVQTLYPTFQAPPEIRKGTFKADVSKYKSCQGNGGSYLPFSDGAAKEAMKSAVSEHYPISLGTMCRVVSGFIDDDAYIKKDSRLIKALTALTILDDSISDNELFYITEDGSPIKKKELAYQKTVTLQPFLLGVWCVASLREEGNTYGKECYSAHWSSDADNTKMLIDKMPDNFMAGLKVIYCEEPVIDEYVEPEDTPDTIVEPVVDPEPESQEETYTQYTDTTMHSAPAQPIFNFTQIGNNNTQIAHVENYYADRKEDSK